MECRVPEKYVNLIQVRVIVLIEVVIPKWAICGRLKQLFNVGVGLHQCSALSPYLFLIHMDVLTYGGGITTRIRDVSGRHCKASLWRQRSKRD